MVRGTNTTLWKPEWIATEGTPDMKKVPFAAVVVEPSSRSAEEPGPGTNDNSSEGTRYAVIVTPPATV